MIKLFVFDWSGTISDDRKPVYEADISILEDCTKKRISFEEWLPNTPMTPIELFRNHGIHDHPDGLFDLYMAFYTEVVEEGLKPVVYGDTTNVFDYLARKEKKIAILSSHPKDNLLKEAKDYGLRGYIDLILASSIDKAKGLIEISERLGEKLEDMLYIGDGVHDIRAGKEAGAQTAGIAGTPQRGYHSAAKVEKENPDFMLDDLCGLLNIN